MPSLGRGIRIAMIMQVAEGNGNPRRAMAMESPWLVKRYCTPRNKVISAPGAGIGVVG